MRGIVFDIKEFALNDGPGIRTTVFMKGCPLRCKWCHNPEGLTKEPQWIRSGARKRLAGTEYESAELAALLLRQRDVYADSGGGVTFSGGEPLMQADFLCGVIERLDDVHVLLDTSGYSDEAAFCSVAGRASHVYFDVKLVDPAEHKRWTLVSNEPILRNLSILDSLGTTYTIRVPLIPRVTDTPDNLSQIAELTGRLENASALHLLPYNSYAGGKYEAVGMKYGIEARSEDAQENPARFFTGLSIQVVCF